MDEEGYVMGGIAFLLIIPALILANIFISVVIMDETQIIPFNTDKLHQISGDIETNIPIFTLHELNEISDRVAKTGEPIPNSRLVIKTGIQTKIDDLYHEYHRNTGINVYCRIDSVDNSEDPYKICVNSTIYVNYNNSTIVRNLSQEVPFSGSYSMNLPLESYKIKDPLPFIKTRGYGVLKSDDDKIYYGTALSNYLRSMGIGNYEVYENASSPLYIKRCPHDPYHTHGHSNMLLSLKNCIDNGYYHESNDGSCILCRLEGKSGCGHMGLETFVVPGITQLQTNTAPCSIDHVIFGDQDKFPVEIYQGNALEYGFQGNISYKLYLDNGHREKYGLSRV